MLGTWLYRSYQFFTALLGRVSVAEEEEAREVLGLGLYPVFAGMPAQYRRHAFTVYRRVRAAGCDDRDVWQAALLHDSGKHDPATGRHVTIVHRVIIVLLAAIPAGRSLLVRLSRPRKGAGQVLARDWRYPFYLSGHHAEMGAGRAEQHGASPAVVSLIAGHHRHGDVGPGLLALQAADEVS